MNNGSSRNGSRTLLFGKLKARPERIWAYPLSGRASQRCIPSKLPQGQQGDMGQRAGMSLERGVATTLGCSGGHPLQCPRQPRLRRRRGARPDQSFVSVRSSTLIERFVCPELDRARLVRRGLIQRVPVGSQLTVPLKFRKDPVKLVRWHQAQGDVEVRKVSFIRPPRRLIATLE